MNDVDKDAFAINDDYYKWCIRAYEALRNRLGLNLKVHPDDELLKQGHIFLFNHFARFETVIPPYIIHRATGASTWTTAAYFMWLSAKTKRFGNSTEMGNW